MNCKQVVSTTAVNNLATVPPFTKEQINYIIITTE